MVSNMSQQMKRLIITGASSGVGEALALTLCSPHLNSNIPIGIHLCGRNIKNLKKVVQECKSRSAKNRIKISYSVGDVGNEADVCRMWKEYKTKQDTLSVDCLIANAATNRPGALEETTMKDFDHVMNTNVKGVWLWLQRVIPSMKEQKFGQLIVTNSVRGLAGGANSTLYTSSKFAVEGLMQCVRKEVKPFGIKVGSVYPAGIATNWWKTNYAALPKGMDNFLTSQDVANAILSIINQGVRSDIEQIVLRSRI